MISQLNMWWNTTYRKIFGYNKWEKVKEVIRLLERLNIQYLVLQRRLLFCKRIELCNNTVVMDVFRNFLNGSEAQMVHAKCKTNQFWSCSAIKSAFTLPLSSVNQPLYTPRVTNSTCTVNSFSVL